MYISMQETCVNLQNKIHACKERELNHQHAMEIQNIEMKSLKKELDAMKNQMPEHERKMLKLMKANVEVKSTLKERKMRLAMGPVSAQTEPNRYAMV